MNVVVVQFALVIPLASQNWLFEVWDTPVGIGMTKYPWKLPRTPEATVPPLPAGPGEVLHAPGLWLVSGKEGSVEGVTKFPSLNCSTTRREPSSWFRNMVKCRL